MARVTDEILVGESSVIYNRTTPLPHSKSRPHVDAIYNNEINQFANAISIRERLQRKHAIKYGSKDGAQADAAATTT